jgi:hypothetical protein
MYNLWRLKRGYSLLRDVQSSYPFEFKKKSVGRIYEYAGCLKTTESISLASYCMRENYIIIIN